MSATTAVHEGFFNFFCAPLENGDIRINGLTFKQEPIESNTELSNGLEYVHINQSHGYSLTGRDRRLGWRLTQ